MRPCPIGIQTFEKVIDDNYLYVDKTEIIYNLTHSNSSYVFLSRPRRFGKSLLLSTLETYFQDPKELSKGLAVENIEKDYDEDFNTYSLALSNMLELM